MSSDQCYKSASGLGQDVTWTMDSDLDQERPNPKRAFAWFFSTNRFLLSRLLKESSFDIVYILVFKMLKRDSFTLKSVKIKPNKKFRDLCF